MSKLIGIDVGGTFTDLMYLDSDTGVTRVHKVPTTGLDPSTGLIRGVMEICDLMRTSLEQISLIFHGTTTATNALLEHDGARVGLITTAGFRDVVHIGRHQRPQAYSIMQDIPWQHGPLARRRDRVGVKERTAANGEVVEPLDEEGVRIAARRLVGQGVEAITVAFINSYRNPNHELRAAEIVRDVFPGHFVTSSASVAPQFREFERFTTGLINAFVGPRVSGYLAKVETDLKEHGFQGQLHLMMSSGGVATVASAKETPVTLLVSGPAAGVLGGTWTGNALSETRLITFDMGGTSADIGIVDENGIREAPARDSWIAGYPVLTPMLDLVTIGAGGGSIAYLDDGGALRVGPRSAGAVPGPACYGRGGTQPTTTDAQLVLGRLHVDHMLGGDMPLDGEMARRAVQGLADRLGLSIEETAEGIIRLANHSMANAVRSRTVQRGLDPRDYSLAAFGGAGPMHAADIAEMLDVRQVLIPPYPGATSAMGMLTTDLKYTKVSTVFLATPLSSPVFISQIFEDQERELTAQLHSDGIPEAGIQIQRSFDCRYRGQGYELRLSIDPQTVQTHAYEEALRGFHEVHHREYGHSFPNDPVEVVNVRTVAAGATHSIGDSVPYREGASRLADAVIGNGESFFMTGGHLKKVPVSYIDRVRIPEGSSFAGPAIIFQRDATTVVPPGWVVEAHRSGNLRMERQML